MPDNPRTTGVDSAFDILDDGGVAKNHLVLTTRNVVGPAARIIDSFSWRERHALGHADRQEVGRRKDLVIVLHRQSLASCPG